MSISIEAKRKYDRERYYRGLRISLFGDRKCRTCDIFLATKHGAYKTRAYCRDCYDNGYAQKDLKRRYYLKNRDRILQNVAQRYKKHENTTSRK